MTGQFIPPTEEDIANNPDNVYCTEEEKNLRLDVCKVCDKFTFSEEKTTECTECGCSISLLTTFTFKSCPLEKW